MTRTLRRLVPLPDLRRGKDPAPRSLLSRHEESGHPAQRAGYRTEESNLGPLQIPALGELRLRGRLHSLIRLSSGVANQAGKYLRASLEFVSLLRGLMKRCSTVTLSSLLCEIGRTLEYQCCQGRVNQ